MGVTILLASTALQIPSLLLIAVAIAVISILRYFLPCRRTCHLPLPPGPPGEPVIGHLRIIPTDNPEYAYMEWGRELKSDILSFRVLGQPIIVLNSVTAAVDLLDKRGANFSDRPRFILFEEMGWGRILSFLPWGPKFRQHRKMLQRSFQKSSIIGYRSLQESEAAILLRSFVSSPSTWENSLRRYATAIVLRAGFGIPLLSKDSPWITIAEDASYALGHGGAPGGTPVDFFPFLRFLPSMFHDRSLKFAHDWRWAIKKIHDAPFAAVTALAPGERQPSLITTLLAQRQMEIDAGQTPTLDEADIKGAAAAVYAAGQDTTWSTLVVFILAMVLRLDIQRKAQAELDKVVGRGRLPTFADRPSLPYLDLVLQETLRWIPVSPLGVPHRSLKDEIYRGYLIPAGSYVFANARAMTHDPAVYSDPETFNPDRYLPRSEGGSDEPLPNGHFGFGRRVCIGKHLGEASVWIAMASILSTMSIERETCEKGFEIIPPVKLTNGLTSHPQYFPCRIRLREQGTEDIIGI
ncbi:O-methylsterigmatocystin oxidoreductase [Ceratocystis lukuohia]|uniref:O-methylsterigmatocystin oxidoreductase n=1 Tax=Ceratocystis lukuohia TaxID=2019550 RepID=A0ABR4MQR8_9PEZI